MVAFAKAMKDIEAVDRTEEIMDIEGIGEEENGSED